jgi:hypothetical protein
MDNPAVENTQAEIPQTENPSKSFKVNKILLVGAFVLVVVLLLGGLLVYGGSKATNTSVQKTVNTGTSGNNNPGQIQQTVVNQATKDTSDTQINKDLQTIDSGINNTDADSTAVDQGLNDQETNLQ